MREDTQEPTRCARASYHADEATVLPPQEEREMNTLTTLLPRAKLAVSPLCSTSKE